MTNSKRNVFYIGVTNNLERRIREHKYEGGSVFTSKYKCFYLVYYEEFFSASKAIEYEKQLKNWHREWKISLIRKDNPEMVDLAEKWDDQIL